ARTQCSVLAFEPAAANFHVLARNIELNGLADRVRAYCVALCGKTELGVLNLASNALGSSLSQFGEVGEISRWAQGKSAGIHGMLGFTVDQFIELFHPPFPTHAKVDVDGLETAIVAGAGRTLRDPRFKSIMIELSLTNQTEREHSIAAMATAG